MKFITDSISLIYSRLETEIDFNKCVNEYDIRLILDFDEQYVDTYDVIKVKNDEEFIIGLKYDNHGLEPNLLLIKNNNSVILTFEDEVVGIGLKNKDIKFRKTMNSIVYDMTVYWSCNLIAIIHEFGIFVLNENGETIWKMGTPDIVIDFKFNSDSVWIKCDDNYEIAFNIENGEVL